MSKVLTFSKTFPTYHPRKGEPTWFVEKILIGLDNLGIPWTSALEAHTVVDNTVYTYGDEPKYHTIRAGKRWKVGDKFSPRVWSGKPYNSKQIIIAPDIEVVKVWDFEVQIPSKGVERWVINGTAVSESGKGTWFNMGIVEAFAQNDGLDLVDFLQWFKHPSPFQGQIICWNKEIEY